MELNLCELILRWLLRSQNAFTLGSKILAVLILTRILVFKIKTPFPAFPHGGRGSSTFPPWGKMKGGTK
jgi:hypothetical protein